MRRGHLIVSRQRNEIIVIGHGDARVEVQIVDIRGDKVRLGVTALVDVPIHRREVADAIEREQRVAAAATSTTTSTTAGGA